MLPSRCPHCQAELPERGRFCVMCGCRVEGWGGLLPASAVPPPGPGGRVPEPVAAREHTRPVAPEHLLRVAEEALDEELLRPTREMPSVGHEVRALAPDHRVHTSPTGTVLPAGVMSALAASLPSDSAPGQQGAGGGVLALHGRPTAILEVRSAYDGVPVAPMPEDATDIVRLRRRSPVKETLNLLGLATLCAAVALGVGLLAYRLMTQGVPQRVAEAPPPPKGGAAPLPPPPAPPLHTASGGVVHRTRDLVISVPPSQAAGHVRRPSPKSAPARALALPPAGPATTPLAPEAPPAAPSPQMAGPAQEARPPAPPGEARPPAPVLSDPKQEAEAQLGAADIEFVASAHNTQVRQCYDRAFKDGAAGSPGGRVELSFTLNEEGRAVNISTVDNTTGNEPVARCLEQRLAEWRFPRPVGGARAYQFPFVFLAPVAGAR